MMNGTGDWKPIAWNGIGFEMPPAWEVGRMGRQYLLIQDGSKAVVELKWRRIKGTFSHKAHLKRLGRQLHKKAEHPLQLITPPESWKKSLTPFQTQCFLWGDRDEGAVGALLFCPQCRTATMIQFFGQGIQEIEAVSRRILASFFDHPTDHWTRISMYDIKAGIPDDFLLENYLFQPGSFKLVFRTKQTRISLYRWGPSSVLLKDGGLKDFITRQFDLPREVPLEVMEEGDMVAWSDPRPVGLIRRLRFRIGRKQDIRWLCFRNWPEKNRVLGMAVEGRLPEAGVLKRIYHHYEAV